jgi:hypothetical protein
MRFIPLLFLLAAPLKAAVVYSGSQNLPVAWDDLEGVYVNVVTGATATTWPSDFDQAPWINLTLGGYGVFNSELIKPVAVSGGASYDPNQTTDYYLNLAEGTVLDSSDDFMENAFGSTNHAGLIGDPGKFVEGTSGFMGFQFQDVVGGDTYYGWLRFTMDGSSFGTLQDWAFENTAGTGITVGAVPEPSAAMLALAGCGMALRRRRR